MEFRPTFVNLAPARVNFLFALYSDEKKSTWTNVLRIDYSWSKVKFRFEIVFVSEISWMMRIQLKCYHCAQSIYNNYPCMWWMFLHNENKLIYFWWINNPCVLKTFVVLLSRKTNKLLWMKPPSAHLLAEKPISASPHHHVIFIMEMYAKTARHIADNFNSQNIKQKTNIERNDAWLVVLCILANWAKM